MVGPKVVGHGRGWGGQLDISSLIGFDGTLNFIGGAASELGRGRFKGLTWFDGFLMVLKLTHSFSNTCLVFGRVDGGRIGPP